MTFSFLRLWWPFIVILGVLTIVYGIFRWGILRTKWVGELKKHLDFFENLKSRPTDSMDSELVARFCVLMKPEGIQPVRRNEKVVLKRIPEDLLQGIPEDWNRLRSSFVSIGLLGTFIGIAIGLKNLNLNVNDSQKLMEQISPLVEGMKTAFWSSVAGIAAYLITLGVDHFVWDGFRKNQGNLRKMLNTYFYWVSDALQFEAQERANRLAERQIDFLEHINRNGTQGRLLLDEVLVALQNLNPKDMKDAAVNMKQSAATLKSSTSMIQGTMEGLQTATETLQRAADNLSSEAIGRFVGEAVQDVIRQELTPVFDQIRFELTKLDKLQELEKLHELTLIKDLLQDIRTEVIEPLNERVVELRRFILDLQKPLAEVAEASRNASESARLLGENVRVFAASVTESVEKIQTVSASLQESSESLIRTIGEMEALHARQMTEFSAKVKQELQSFASQMKEITEGSMQQYEEAQKQAIRDLSETLQRTVSEFKDAMSAATEDIYSSLRQNMAEMRESIKASHDLTHNVHALLQSQSATAHQSLSTASNILSENRKLLHRFEDISELSFKGIENLRKSIDSMEESDKQREEFYNLADDAMTGLFERLRDELEIVPKRAK